MSQPQASPAWASTAVGDLLCGPCQDATVRASTKLASYLSVPRPGTGTDTMALLSEEAVRLPIGVVLANAELPEAGSTVVIGNGSIASGEHTWRPARWWDPRPRLSAEDLFRHGPELLFALEEEPYGSFGLPLAEALAVAGALADGDAGPALGVIGLGPGPHPLGRRRRCWGARGARARRPARKSHKNCSSAACASTRTTALSAALIAAASRGQVIPQAATLLGALAAGATAHRLASAATQLFCVGATSGHDLCAGMAGALIASASAPARPAQAAELAMITRRSR